MIHIMQNQCIGCSLSTYWMGLGFVSKMVRRFQMIALRKRLRFLVWKESFSRVLGLRCRLRIKPYWSTWGFISNLTTKEAYAYWGAIPVCLYKILDEERLYNQLTFFVLIFLVILLMSMCRVVTDHKLILV